jgi:hypothetical protein
MLGEMQAGEMVAAEEAVNRFGFAFYSERR